MAHREAGDTCRLLYVVGELDKGGLERQLFYLVRALHRDGYRPAVAVWNYDDRDVHCRLIRALDVPVYAVGKSRSRIAKLNAFRTLVHRLSPELVHSYSFHTNFAATWASWGTNITPVGSIRSDFEWAKQGSGPLLGRLSGRWPGFQISNSASAATSARTCPSYFSPRRCEVVHNGIDLDAFSPRPLAKDGPPHIAAIGYLLPVKRWDRLIDAAASLTNDRVDFTVALIGGGPLRADLETRAVAAKVADRVKILDHTDDVAGVMAAARFVALTSDSEGYPNVLMEAMACGRAVVATAVGDVSHLVEHGVTGFLVEPGDQRSLTQRMADLATNPELCERMGRAARRKAEREFGLDRFVGQTLDAYRQAGWNDSPRMAHREMIAAR